MITLIHIAFNLIIYFILGKSTLITITIFDLILLLLTNLIDFDHLTSKPIYKSKRNPFKTHLLHKNYLILSAIAIIFLFIRPIMFLGIGILAHFLIDYLELKIK